MHKKNIIKIDIIKKTTFYLSLIILWYVIYILGVNILKWWKPYAIPNPKGVFDVFIYMVKDGSLFLSIIYTLKRAFIGYAISIIIGLILGLFVTRFKFADKNIRPLILGMQTLPSICWVPFAILWFGITESSIIFVIIMGSTFCVAMAVENGIKNVNPLYIKVAKTMGANERQLYIRVILPASLPSLINGLKQGWSFAWRALLSGEVLSASIGLGHSLMLGRDLADINQVMLIMIIIVIVGALIDKYLFSKIENTVLKKMGFI